MTVTPAVEEEEKKEEKPKEKFKFSFDYFNESRLGIFALVVGAIIAVAAFFPSLPAFVKGIGAIVVILWGADSVRKTARYGLGTGVPSIGVLAVGFGLVGATTGMAIGSEIYHYYGSIGILGVLAGVAFMAVVGYVSGVLANSERFIGMKIPGLERGMAELAMAGTLAIILECSIVAGSWYIGDILSPIKGYNITPVAFIAVMFILAGFGMLQPYNSCLGADERRGRTLLMAIEIGGINCIILGAVATMSLGAVQGVPLLVLGAIVWVVFYRAYMKACMEESYAAVGTGLIKTLGG
ncbi:tetrahydromethanopterin S-methyltransferase subunit C [Methanophagales archaeon]|nr:MAG: tetrahydromethanopterin S-methyltransferase subunit C [Methanophagales archaeon]